jgi:anti-anti-sigma factor
MPASWTGVVAQPEKGPQLHMNRFPLRIDSRMPGHVPYRWLEVEQIGDVTVVRFTHRGVLMGAAVELVGEQLLSLVEDEGRRQLVLNLGNVRSMDSAMLGKLLMLNKRVLASNGRFKLCQVTSELYEVFEAAKLPQLVGIYDEELDALDTF